MSDRVRPLTEGMVRKGGTNPGPSQIKERPAPPAPINVQSNNAPDVLLELTHEEATFLLDNCQANTHLGLKMIMIIGGEKGPLEEKREKAQKYVELNEKFHNITKKLRKAGAKEKE